MGHQRGAVKLDPTALSLWPRLLHDKLLQPIARLRIELLHLGMSDYDVLANNVGRRAFRMDGWPAPPSLVLLDTGGVVDMQGRALPTSAIPSLPQQRAGAANVASRGHANQACPGQGKLEAEFGRLLGVDRSGGHCELVPQRKLQRITRRHNWKSTPGIVGFHTPDDKIYVDENNEWSVAHELGHRYHLTDDHIGRWFCEGLAEITAKEAAKNTGEPHKDTYTYEVSLIERYIVPATGMSGLELAALVAQSAANEGGPNENEAVAARMTRGGWGRLPRSQVQDAISSRTGDEPDLFMNILPSKAA